jgi:PAS domain-containing protein
VSSNQSGAQHNLVLILARDLASRLATAVFLVDPKGDLVYFNEAAEALLGRPFVEGETMAAEAWGTGFRPVDEHGDPIPVPELPLAVAISDRRPAHREMAIRGEDGVERPIAVTAVPLFTHADELVGGMAVFWEHAET